MNIIYIHTHDTGRFISPYGYSVPTPALNGFAKSGTLFRNAFCAGPTCSPSRAALLTGSMPHSCGMLGLAHRGFAFSDYTKHLASFLSRNGYETVLCGVQHESTDTADLGYEKILPGTERILFNGESRDDMTNAKTVSAYIKQRKGGRPLFLSYGLSATHREYHGDTVINPDYVMPPSCFPDLPEVRKDYAAFLESAGYADKCIGMVLQTLKEKGMFENSLIFYTTDHGIAFPDMKCSLYDSGIGVSLIMSLPGNSLAGRACDALVSHIDIFPTICEAAKLKIPDWVEGKSLLGVLRGKETDVNDRIFSEVNFHASYEPMRCVRTKRFKYIRKYYADTIRLANIDDGATKALLKDAGFANRAIEPEMLFDLYLDPQEKINLIDNPRYSKEYEDLKKMLDDQMRKTNDPLCAPEKAVRMPAGARINKAGSLSPKEQNFV